MREWIDAMIEAGGQCEQAYCSDGHWQSTHTQICVRINGGRLYMGTMYGGVNMELGVCWGEHEAICMME